MNRAFHDGPGPNSGGQNSGGQNSGGQNSGGQNSGGQNSGGQNGGGWYPDPSDPRGLRYWDGVGWTDHRAQLSGPAVNPAVCSCGVVATGSCRGCGHPFCRAHISELPREDRAYLRRWDAWTCGGCIELGRRELRSEQLDRCESVAPHLAELGAMRRVRTYTGLRPRKVHLFDRVPGVQRPPRVAHAYLIEYDAGEENSTYQGLAISADGTVVYDVGVPMLGVKNAHVGPTLRRSGYHLRRAISIDALREAAAAPTEQTWFEYASRAYLRAAKRLMIEPDQATSLALAIDVPPAQVPEAVANVEPASVTELSQPVPSAARPGSRRSRRAGTR